MEEDDMSEFRLTITQSPWHAILERVPRTHLLEGAAPHRPLRLEFSSPLELVGYLERFETWRRGLR